MLNNIKKNLLVICSIIVLIFSRFYRLGLDIVHNDAFYFKNHSYQFIQNVQNGVPEFFLAIQPGLLTVYSNIIGYKAFFILSDLSLIKVSGKHLELLMHTFQKIPQTSLNILLVMFSAWLLGKLFSKFKKRELVLSLFILLMALEPDLILHSRVIQNDLLQGLLILASLLSYYYGNLKGNRNWFAVAGIFAGLSFLQKSSSLVLLPFLFGYEVYKNRDFIFKQKYKELFTSLFKRIGTVFLLFLITSYIFFPAYWFEPVETLKNMTLTVFFKTRGLESDFGFVETPHIQGNFYYIKYFLSKYSLFYLIGILLSLYFVAKNKVTKKYKTIFVYLLSFSVFYILLLHVSEKKIFRYMLVPSVTLTPLVVFGYVFLLNNIKRVYSHLFIILYTLFFSFIFFSYFPDFGLYKNLGAHLVGYTLPIDGYKGYVEGGTGMYKLSRYLNTKYPSVDVSLPRSDGLNLFLNAEAHELDFVKVSSSEDLVVLYSGDPNSSTIIELGYSPIDSYIINRDLSFTLFARN